jgi:hypothetical protein
MAEPKEPRPLWHDRIVSGTHHAAKTVDLTTGSKPTIRGGVAGGAAKGAVTGAGAGSLFGPEGTVVGAGGGAVLGAASGGVKAHAAKKAAKRAKHAALGPGRQLLVAEFILCMVILALSPLTDRHKTEGPQAFLKRGAATCALFFILGLISSAGRGPTKIAAYGGGLVTLTLLVSDRDVFAALAAKLTAGDTTDDGFEGADTLGVDDTADPGAGIDPSGQDSDSSGASDSGSGLGPGGTATGRFSGGGLLGPNGTAF